jgi:hypothetical protein
MVRASGGGHGKQAIHKEGQTTGTWKIIKLGGLLGSRADDPKLSTAPRPIVGHDLLLDTGLQEHKRQAPVPECKDRSSDCSSWHGV